MHKALRFFSVFVLFLLFLSNPLAGICQISVPQWVDDVSGPGVGSSTPAAVKVDKQNNVYVTGIFRGTVDFDPSAGVKNLSAIGGGENDYDTYLAKYTPAGALIWVVSFGGYGLDQVNGMSIDDNGNPTVIGQFNSDMVQGITLHNNGGNDGFIVHFDTNGNFKWGKSVGGSSTDYGDKVESDHQGNIIAVLQYSSSVSVGAKTYTSSSGSFNGLIIKYDINGGVLWSINLSDTGDSEVRYVAADASNNIFVSGAFGNNVNFNPLGASHTVNGNGGSTFLAKYTPNGALTWVQQVGGQVVGNNSNLFVNSNDEVYLDGPFGATLQFNGNTSLTPIGSRDIFISKYAADGTFQMAKDIGGVGALMYNYGMGESSDNNIYISGFFSGSVDFDPSPTSVATVHDHGQQDLFLAKYDGDLNYKWAISAGSGDCNQTLGRNVAVDHNNDVLLVGTFCSTVNFDASNCSSLTLKAQSDFRDGFVAKYVQSKASSAGQITAFSVPQEVSPALIDQTKLKITVTVPAGTNVTALIPTITATTGATLVPASGVSQDFSSAVNYNLSKTCTSLNYTVTVIYAAATATQVTTCAGTLKTITGDAALPTPDTYKWQVLQGSTWVDAPGVINGKDYQTSALTNNTAANIVYDLRRQISTGGVISFDSYYDVTVQPIIAVSNNTINPPATSIFCATGTPLVITGSTPAGGNGTYAYQWQSSADNVTFVNISGATAKDYTPATINATTYYRRTVTSGTCTAPTQSNVVTLTIIPAIANNTIQPPAVTGFCASGNPAVFVGSTPTGGTGTYVYQWQISADNVTFTDIAGATGKDYQTSVISTTTYYRREVTSGSCSTPSVSNVVQITILPVLANNSITPPSITSFCTSGDPSVITGSTPTGGSGTYGYQWQSSVDNTTFTDITGATAKDYDPAAIIATTYYRRLVTSGTCNTPLVSNVVTITVVITAIPVTNNVIAAPAVTSFCASGKPQAITGNTPSGGTGSYIYQWQSSADNATFTDISGATAKDYAPSAITATTYYRRGVTSGSCATPLMSNVVKITVQPVVANNVITAPAVTSFCNTGDPLVITGSLPTGGDGTYTYQWQSSADNITFSNIAGATTQNYDPAVITATTYYRRVVASVLCNTPLVSNTVAMVIQASPAAPVPVASPVLVCAGNAATLAVASPQAGLTYNWYSSPSKTNILFTGVTYVTNPVNITTVYYIEAVSSSCSSTSLATVQVNVTSAPPAPLVVNSQVPVCSGSMATLSVLNPQSLLTYNWYAAASGGSSIYTGTDFVTPAVTSNTTYYVEAANNGGCTSFSRTPVNVTVNQLPQLTVQGASVCPGSNATLTASAANSTINWYADATGGSIIHTGTSYMVMVNANTNYYAEAVNNTTGCVSAARAVVQAQLLQQLPAPVVSKQSSTISSITFQWDAVDGATGYQVSTDNGQIFTDPSSGVDGLTHTITGLQPNEAATIIVRATGKASCELSTSSTAFTAAAVSALGDKIFVANAFTPNGDGKNDVVYVHSDNIKSLKFYVYDQWDELIYTSSRQADGWDGTYKGSKEPVGVYVYYLEAIMYGGEQVNKKGTITLLR